jgi:hypothetical protein
LVVLLLPAFEPVLLDRARCSQWVSSQCSCTALLRLLLLRSMFAGELTDHDGILLLPAVHLLLYTHDPPASCLQTCTRVVNKRQHRSCRLRQQGVPVFCSALAA